MVDELTHVHGETRDHPVDHGDIKQGPGPPVVSFPPSFVSVCLF
jgi:hypothetical protein